MSEPVVNYKRIITMIEQELYLVYNSLLSSGSDEVKKEIKKITGIEVSDEQMFLNNKVKKPGCIYIVVKFSSGPTNYATSQTPMSLSCIGTKNSVKPAQILLGAFAATWTTKNFLQGVKDKEGNDIEDKYALQVWNTPEVFSNFNELGNAFVSLYRVSGVLVVGPEAVRVGVLTYIPDPNDPTKNEEMNIMSFSDNFQNALNPQPFGNTFGFTKSEAKFSNYTFTFSTYLLNSQLAADFLAVKGFRYRGSNAAHYESNKKPNDDFIFKIELTNGFTNYPDSGETPTSDDPILGSDFFSKFKLVSGGNQQEIGNIPSLTLSFTH